MWLWWTISMLIVSGCIIYAMYILISSRKLHKLISSGAPPKNINKNLLSIAKDFIIQQQPPGGSNLNQQFSGENPAIYLNQINNFQQRLQLLENEINIKKNVGKVKVDQTDWEKL